MATDPRILSSAVKTEMTDDKSGDTSLNVERDLAVLGSDTPVTDHETDLSIPPSQNEGEDGSARPRNTVGGGDSRHGAAGNPDTKRDER